MTSRAVHFPEPGAITTASSASNDRSDNDTIMEFLAMKVGQITASSLAASMLKVRGITDGTDADNVMGDMAFSTVGLDVETAVRCGIPTMTVVNNNSFMSIYDGRPFPPALEDYRFQELSGRFSEVAQAMGAYSEKITEPQEIVPAIKRGLEATSSGKTVVLEFITRDEGNFSKF